MDGICHDQGLGLELAAGGGGAVQQTIRRLKGENSGAEKISTLVVLRKDGWKEEDRKEDRTVI